MDIARTQNLKSPFAFGDMIELLKPRITLLAIITTAVGMWLAPNPISIQKIIWTLVATTLLVGGANALNMFLERDLDSLMERTRTRPLPEARLSPEFGIGFGCLLVGIAIPLLLFYVNPLTAWLSLASLVTYLLIYTPLKQHTSLSLWVGAIPGAAPPLLGWTAAANAVELPGLALFGIIFLWQIPHFLAIGTFRKEEYARAGYKIFPLKKSPASIKLQMVIVTLLLIPFSFTLVPLGYGGKIYISIMVVLNVVFLVSILKGLWKKDQMEWGRNVFRVSLIYLIALFIALVIDQGIY